MVFVVQHNGYTIFVFFLLQLNHGAWPSRRGVFFLKVLAGGHKQLSRLELLISQDRKHDDCLRPR